MIIKIDGKEYGLIPLEEGTGKWEPFGATGMFAGTITTRKYKCPLCGKGEYVHVDEDTPGDRDHYSYLNCENCDPERVLYHSAIIDSWNLEKNSPEEIEHIRAMREKTQLGEEVDW